MNPSDTLVPETPADKLARYSACGIIELDASLRVVAINAPLLDWLNIEAKDCVGPDGAGVSFVELARINDEECVQRLRKFVASALAGIPPAALHIRLWGKGRSFITARLLAGEVDLQAPVPTVNVSIIDATEEMDTIRELKAKIAFLQGTVDRSPSALAYFDADLVCRFSNRAHSARYGRVPAGVVGLHLEDILSPALLKDLLPRIARVLSGESLSFEAERQGDNGEHKFFSVRLTPDFDGAHVVGFFAEHNDITDRKMTEDLVFVANQELEEQYQRKALECRQQAEQLAHLALEARDRAQFVVDADGTIVAWPPGAARLFDRSEAACLGRNIEELFVSERSTPLNGDLIRRLPPEDSETVARVSAWGLRSGDRRFWADCSFAPLSCGADERRLFSCVVHDLTESGLLEGMLRSQGRSLQDEVQKQAALLSRINEDFDNFSYLVGHDFRAPLRHIKGYVQLLKESEVVAASSPDLRYVDDIDRLASKMGGMVDALLEYTRLGSETPAFAKVDVGQLIKATVGQFKAQHSNRLIHWEVEPEMPQVRGDPALLGEMFSRLVDNAVKFTAKTAGATIQVGVREGSPGRCVIFIKDNGAGFDAAQAPNLYLLIQRQHHTMDFPGLGTGLAISQRIAQKHGGTIECVAKRDEGCTVYLEIPLWTQQTAAA